ncbi:MAG: YgiQ family radical SAM protein [Planctomycetota bacterium]
MPLEPISKPTFPPSTPAELEKAGWDRPDILLITGDAYVDHPSFGAAMISRVLMDAGFRVAILPQPDWRSAEPFKALGKPRLFIAVTSGNVDSMIANYTAFRNKRATDAYSPEGRTGLRPNRACLVYAQRAREALPGIPVVLGGVEAGMRRLSHYDFWEDKLRRSILLDAKADLILYGMAEASVVGLARALDSGLDLCEARAQRGAVYAADEGEADSEALRLPGFDQCAEDHKALTASFRLRHKAADPFADITLVEPYGTRLVVQTPPARPLSASQLDGFYELPFTGKPHPCYGAKEIPALRTVGTSLVSHRGCFGGCHFCGIGFHQGRYIQSRSKSSLKREAQKLTLSESFHGTINDVGGPTANMFGFTCRASRTETPCRRPFCLLPTPCRHLVDGHGESMAMLRTLRNIPGVNHVFVQSGLRHDLALFGKGLDYLRMLVKYHISGTLKVAPEHADDKVLKTMGKPGFALYERFRREFERINREERKRQFLVSYFISAHPGCGRHEMQVLKRKLDEAGLNPEQVQDYIPLPGTPASIMYHTGLDPFTDQPVYVAKTDKERREQRGIIQKRRS